MNIFTQLRTQLTVPEVARHYGIEFDRQNRARCLFHYPDKHPSMKLYDTRYRCFACGASGDVVNLAQHLLGYTRPIDAAKRLNADFALGLSDAAPTRAERAAAQQARERLAAFEAWLQDACVTLARACRQMERWMQNPEHPNYVLAAQHYHRLDYLYEQVFVYGDYAEQVAFYQNHREEVEQLAQLLQREACAS